MRINPFREHRDSLFTDYALQIFNAHVSDNSQDNLSKLMDSYQSEAMDNPAFMPGVIFGSMVHMFMMVQMLSDERGIETEEMIKEYTDYYNINRVKLAKMLGNRPEYANKLIREMFKEENE
jgi:hypothetical protein